MVTFIEVALVVVLLLYVVTIIAFAFGWKKTRYFEQHRLNGCSTKVVVIVVFKNEEERLRVLLSAMANQSYKSFQLILVNDHSSDESLQVIEFMRHLLPPINLIQASGHGKKNGLKEALDSTDAELILTTDADCKPVSMWVETMLDFYRCYNSDLILAPVKFSRSDNMFQKLQQVEFISLVASTLGATGISAPIMANGANMAFTHKAWTQIESLKPNYSSGDDMFLLHGVKKNNGKINFIKSRNALVYTEAADSVRGFLQQRQRWTSKASGYTDFDSILTAIIVFLINFAIVASAALAFVDIQYLQYCVLLIVAKFSVDYGFLLLCNRFFGITNLFAKSILIAIPYPFYILFTSLTGIFMKNPKWK